MKRLLEIERLSLRFGGITALEDVSFAIERGRIAALIGPNGAGKTSLFNCVTGFYRPSAGVIRLHGPNGPRELQAMAQTEIAAQARLARSFQNIRLFGAMSCLENLLVAQYRRSAPGVLPSLLGLARAKAAERAAVEVARELLVRFDLLEFADNEARTLPYGAQRRLEIARALATDPMLLCLDEPAAGLNEHESAELAERLERLRVEGLSLFLIEHDMGLVMRIADQVIVLDQGRKIADGTPDQVKRDQRVIAAYLGEEAA
jgi:branched-chain amino acid transport system ATP-binding protein